MKKLIFDVETNGLDCTASVLSFSALLLDDDLNVIDEINRYYHIRPGEAPNDEAIGVNGLTPDVIEAKRAGADYPEIFGEDRFIRDLFDPARIDTLIAHNIEFDRKFIEHHHKLDLSEFDQVCTMKGTQYLYDAPSYKNGEPKWPRLSEAAAWAKVDLDEIAKRTSADFHTSLFDVYVTLEIYKAMRAER